MTNADGSELDQWYANRCHDYENPHEVEPEDSRVLLIPRELDAAAATILERALYLAGDLKHARLTPDNGGDSAAAGNRPPGDEAAGEMKIAGIRIVIGGQTFTPRSYYAQRMAAWPERADRIVVDAVLKHSNGKIETCEYPADLAAIPSPVGTAANPRLPEPTIIIVTKNCDDGLDTHTLTDILTRFYGPGSGTSLEVEQAHATARAMALTAYHGDDGRKTAIAELASEWVCPNMPPIGNGDERTITIDIFRHGGKLLTAASTTDRRPDTYR
ncbi:MAG: hypothetical protein OXG35_11420 [Acidobacteria bacterium]|nr:hypothetical protein [Acidobacteriota bacterium]